MAFCVNCGKEWNQGAKFCEECGTRLGAVLEEDKKGDTCHICGASIPAYTAICPFCGNEVEGKKASAEFSDFLEQVKTLEKAITDAVPNTHLYKHITLGKKLFWILLNVGLLGFPLLIRLIINLINTNSTPDLTYEEQQLATFVENYTFPNNREVILEALVFTKEKIDFVSREKTSRKNNYWMRLWYSKAQQLKEKADILFPKDIIVHNSFQEIQKDREKMVKSSKWKFVFGVVLLILFIGFWVYVIGGETTEFAWGQTGGFKYLPVPKDCYGEVLEDTQEVLAIRLTSTVADEYHIYQHDCETKGFTVNPTQTNTFYSAENEQGHRLTLVYSEKDSTVVITLVMEK